MTGIEEPGIEERRRFVEFLDDAKAGAVAADRSRERWLRQQTAEAAQFVGQLVDLIERRTPVTLRTASGGAHQGVIAAVGQDFCVLQGAREVYVALDAVVGVHAQDHPVATGDRAPPLDLTLVELFGRLACEQPRLRLSLRGDCEPVVGRLRAVGVDVLTLRTDGPTQGAWFVPAAAVWEAVVVRG